MGTRFTTAMAAALFSFSVSAANLPAFTELDTDRDGNLTQTELEVVEQFQGEDSDFVSADQNDDGVISADEYQAWMNTELEALQTAKK